MFRLVITGGQEVASLGSGGYRGSDSRQVTLDVVNVMLQQHLFVKGWMSEI